MRTWCSFSRCTISRVSKSQTMMSAYTDTIDNLNLAVSNRFPQSYETYLKALVGFLSTGNVLSCVGAHDHRDLIVVPAEELLCSANNVSDNDGSSEREDDVLVVGMQNQSIVHLACKEEVSEIEQLIRELEADLPLNPMTADSSRSVDTILPLLSLKSFAFSFLNKIDFNTREFLPLINHSQPIPRISLPV